jgi:hypothetical protein
MLLNNFLYENFVLKNQQLQERRKYNSLVPKGNIYDSEFIKNSYGIKEYIEEIKLVDLDGGLSLSEQELDTTEDDKIITLLEEKVEDLKEEDIEKDKKIESLQEEIVELEEEQKWKPVTDEKEEEKCPDIDQIKEVVENTVEDVMDGGDIKHKDIVFDNISKNGGNSSDKEVKNIVVSFF